MNRSKVFYFCGFVLCFSIGAYFWKITHKGPRPNAEEYTSNQAGEYKTPTILVYVGDKPISSEDLDFEYSLATNGVFDSEELTPIPDLGSRYEKELSPLKERLMASLIERKLLYQQILKDDSFDYDNPKRFVECLKEWQNAVKAGGEVLSDPKDKERLKVRMCEKSLLTQYLDERVFTKIEIDDSEIMEYFRNHAAEFKMPARVLIRQIVLPSEKDAINARPGLNIHNFAEKAKQLSITPEAEEGGLLGPFAKGEMPGIFDEVFTMREGQIYGILKSTYGFHLIMLEKKLPKVELSLKDATPKIRKRLKKKKQEEEYRKWIEVSQNTVSIRMPAL